MLIIKVFINCLPQNAHPCSVCNRILTFFFIFDCLNRICVISFVDTFSDISNDLGRVYEEIRNFGSRSRQYEPEPERDAQDPDQIDPPVDNFPDIIKMEMGRKYTEELQKSCAELSAYHVSVPLKSLFSGGGGGGSSIIFWQMFLFEF